MDPMESMSVSGGRVPANFNAEDAGNMEDMEKQFAVKVVQHMQTYWSILEKVKGSTLRLTKMDDEIYSHLKEAFPEFDPAATVDEDEMKSKDGKERWRNFMMAYEKKVDDYNFGTMVRNNAKAEYEENTTIFDKAGRWADSAVSYIVPRMQFYAIEIARNKNGLNDWIYEQAQGQKAK
ncbi:polysaccharide biosynthesis protein [Metarhizium robertsii]|uniref:Protein PBDC1 homolog n=1 Tax=Metarhizium robertsii TaxID=568076 RepID=A0A0A1V4D8_9HYPO|nr:polysaccharide biosynthesis protein [Metarhizium robertsii]